jgi:hypothetical protein
MTQNDLAETAVIELNQTLAIEGVSAPSKISHPSAAPLRVPHRTSRPKKSQGVIRFRLTILVPRCGRWSKEPILQRRLDRVDVLVWELLKEAARKTEVSSTEAAAFRRMA